MWIKSIYTLENASRLQQLLTPSSIVNGFKVIGKCIKNKPTKSGININIRYIIYVYI